MNETGTGPAARYRFLILGVCLTPIALILGFASGGGGHGSYIGARILLPYAWLAMGTYPEASLVVASLAVVQWPVYGAFLDRTAHRLITALAVLAVHVTVCVWLFAERVR